jgi:type IV secretion system protein VirB6
MNPLDLLPGLEQMQMFAMLMGALDVARANISTIAVNVMAQIATTVQVVMLLYIILYGFMFMNGAVKENLHDVLIRVFKLGFVIWFAFNSVDYVGYAVNYVWTLPEDLITFLLPPNFVTTIAGFATLGLGSATTNIDLAAGLIAAMMSAVMSIINSSLQAAEAAGSVSSLTILSTAMGVMAGGLTAVTLGSLIVAKVSLAILLALGPVFVPTILFEKTKHLFDGWLGQIVNYVLLLLLMSVAIYILFPVLLVIIASYFALAKLVGLTISDSVQLTALLGIFIAVMKQVPSTAASISRGYALSVPDSTGAAQANPGQTARQAGQG